MVSINDINYFRLEMDLTQFSISTTAKRMGRPPLNNKPVLVRLPEEALEKIDELVGTYGRAKFIREAVEAEIERRERREKSEEGTG